MKYKFTSVIILLYIAFIFQSCVSVSNEKSVQDIWELQRLNTYWNKYNITYFTVSIRGQLYCLILNLNLLHRNQKIFY